MISPSLHDAVTPAEDRRENPLLTKLHLGKDTLYPVLNPCTWGKTSQLPYHPGSGSRQVGWFCNVKQPLTITGKMPCCRVCLTHAGTHRLGCCGWKHPLAFSTPPSSPAVHHLLLLLLGSTQWTRWCTFPGALWLSPAPTKGKGRDGEEALLSVKGQTENTLGFPGHNVSVRTTQLCQWSMKQP